MKFHVLLEREIRERTTVEVNVLAKDVKQFMRDDGLALSRDDDWRDYVDRYLDHQVDLAEAVWQSTNDIETLDGSIWEVVDVTE